MIQVENKPAWFSVRISAPVAGMFMLAVAVYLIHLYYIRAYVIDVPFWDEWDMFVPGGLDKTLNWQWVFSFHNEHRIVFTKLLIWIFYRVNHWNIHALVTFNFIIYGVLLIAFGAMLRTLMPNRPTLCIAMLLPLLSTSGYENYFWAFQSQMYLFLLLSILGVMCLYDEKQSHRRIALGALLLSMATLAMTPGLVCAAAAAGVYIPFKLTRIRAGADRRRELGQMFVFLAVMAAVVVLWSMDYPKDDRGISATWPVDPSFWRFFGVMATLGFGYGFSAISESPWMGALCSVLLMLPLFLLPRMGASPARWRATALALGLLGIMLATSYGRASLGYRTAAAPRYVCIVAPLGILALASVIATLKQFPRIRWAIVIVLLVTIVAGNRADWNYAEEYRFHATRCRIGLAELTGYYNAVYVLGYSPEPDGPVVPMIYPKPLGELFVRAVELRVSFVRTMERSTYAKTQRVKPPAAHSVPPVSSGSRHD